MDAGAALLTVEEARSLRAAGEWRVLVERASALSRDALLADAELAFLYAVGCRRVGETALALELAGEVEPEARRRGDARLLAETVNLIGNALFEAGRMDDAEARFEELLELASARGDEELTARASNNLGVLANVRGRRDLALTAYQRALASYQRLGNVRGLAETHHNLGISYFDLGFDREADAHFARAGALAETEGLRDVAGLAEMERARLRARQGDGELAERMAQRARDRFRAISDPTNEAQALRVTAAAARARGDDAAAGQRLEEALAIALRHEDALLRAEVQRDRGLLLRDLRGDGEAREALADAALHFDRIGALAEGNAVRAILAGMDGG
jgi:tetratricopeptide (TPR) repeat protein